MEDIDDVLERVHSGEKVIFAVRGEEVSIEDVEEIKGDLQRQYRELFDEDIFITVRKATNDARASFWVVLSKTKQMILTHQYNLTL